MSTKKNISTSSKLHLLPLRKDLNAPNDLLEAKLLPTHGQHDYPPKIGSKALRYWWKLAKSSSGCFCRVLGLVARCFFCLGGDSKAIRNYWVFSDLGWKNGLDDFPSHSKYPIFGTKTTNVSPHLCIPNKSWSFFLFFLDPGMVGGAFNVVMTMVLFNDSKASE